MTEKVEIDEVSRSCDLPKKEIFDGLHKHLRNVFAEIFPKKEIFNRLHKNFLFLKFPFFEISFF